MIITYIGNFRPEFSTENDVKKSFEALGHDVVALQEDKTTVDEILREAEFSDLVVYTKTWGIKGDEDALVSGLRQLGVPSVSLHLDLYWGLKRESTIGEGFFWKADYVFSADGGNQKRFKKMGVNHYWMPPAVLKDSCYIAEPDLKKYPHEIVFVGSWNKYHEEYPHRKNLVEFLINEYGDNFKAHGSNGDTIRGHDLNVLYSSAKIIIGDSIESDNYWSDRVPETIGRGGFMLFPKTVGLDVIVRDGEHYISYDRYNFKDIKKKIDFWLTNDEERNKIRLAGHEHIKKINTYENLCSEILKIIFA